MELEFVRGKKITAKALNALRANRVSSPNTIQTPYGTYQRKSVVAADGGTPTPAEQLYVKIIAALSNDQNGVTGISQYVCRFDTSSYEAWVEEGGTEDDGDYSENAYVTGSNNRLYQCKLVLDSGLINPVLDTTEVNWALMDEVAVRIWHDPGNLESPQFTSVEDMRDYTPRLTVGQRYPVIEWNEEYYFQLQFSYVGVPGERSISWNEEEDRMMACVSDTVGST